MNRTTATTLVSAVITCMASGFAFAQNTLFQPGDAFFAGVVASDTWSRAEQSPDVPQFGYFLDPGSLKGEADHGAAYLHAKELPRELRLLITWSLQQPFAQELPQDTIFAGRRLEQPPAAAALFMIYPQGYDINRHGLFLRYNEVSGPRTDGQHLVSARLVGQSRDHAATVPPIRFPERASGDPAPATSREQMVTIDNCMAYDFYLLAAPVFHKIPQATNPLIEKYAAGHEGLVLYCWRQGKITRMIHDGERWEERGQLVLPDLRM